MQKYKPPRTRALLARESPQAILICRCRARQVATVGWDRETDRFTIGQWLKGQLEARQADISPDGQHWIYSGYDPRRHRANERWTAIARTPYLKALALKFSTGPGGPNAGGGVFLDNRTYHPRPCPVLSLETQSDSVDFKMGPEPPLEKHERLEDLCRRRNGWDKEVRPRQYASAEEQKKWEETSRRVESSLRRTLPEGSTIDTSAMLKQNYWVRPLAAGWILEIGPLDLSDSRTERYRLRNPANSQALDRPSWQWADWDPVGQRVVWTEDGFLRAAEIGSAGLEETRDLFDANPLRFEEIAAPY